MHMHNHVVVANLKHVAFNLPALPWQNEQLFFMYITTDKHKCTTHTQGELGKHCSCGCRNHSNTRVRGPQSPMEEERDEERRGEEEEKMKKRPSPYDYAA